MMQIYVPVLLPTLHTAQPVSQYRNSCFYFTQGYHNPLLEITPTVQSLCFLFFEDMFNLCMNFGKSNGKRYCVKAVFWKPQHTEPTPDRVTMVHGQRLSQKTHRQHTLAMEDLSSHVHMNMIIMPCFLP